MGILKAAFLVIAFGGLALAGSADVARAQDGASIMNWRASMPQPVVRSRQSQPTAYRARRRYDPPASSAPRVLQDDSELGLHMPEIKIALPLPADEARIKVALIGDSMAEALAFGMDADTGFKIDFLLRQRTVSSSGLVRDDFHDWPKAFATLLAQNTDLAAVVVMVGLNDKQVMRNGADVLEPFSEAWRDAYRRRIDSLLTLARDAKVPLLWVGMPVMRLPKLSADMLVINDLVRERVSASGQTFIDTMDAFTDSSGGFTPTGPDVIGDIVRLRGADGIHFTPAGQRKLAFFVERPLRRLLNERLSPKSSPAIAVSVPVIPEAAAVPEALGSVVPAAPPQVTAPKTPTPTLSPTVDVVLPIAVPEGLIIPFGRQRPAIGDIRPINERRPASSLAGRDPAPLADETNRQVFDRGLPPSARSGRADDFSWR